MAVCLKRTPSVYADVDDSTIFFFPKHNENLKQTAPHELGIFQKYIVKIIVL